MKTLNVCCFVSFWLFNVSTRFTITDQPQTFSPSIQYRTLTNGILYPLDLDLITKTTTITVTRGCHIPRESSQTNVSLFVLCCPCLSNIAVSSKHEGVGEDRRTWYHTLAAPSPRNAEYLIGNRSWGFQEINRTHSFLKINSYWCNRHYCEFCFYFLHPLLKSLKEKSGNTWKSCL